MKGTDPAFRDRFADKIEKFARNLCPFFLSGFLQRLPGIEPAKIYQLKCVFDLISRRDEIRSYLTQKHSCARPL